MACWCCKENAASSSFACYKHNQVVGLNSMYEANCQIILWQVTGRNKYFLFNSPPSPRTLWQLTIFICLAYFLILMNLFASDWISYGRYVLFTNVLHTSKYQKANFALAAWYLPIFQIERKDRKKDSSYCSCSCQTSLFLVKLLMWATSLSLSSRNFQICGYSI